MKCPNCPVFSAPSRASYWSAIWFHPSVGCESPAGSNHRRGPSGCSLEKVGSTIQRSSLERSCGMNPTTYWNYCLKLFFDGSWKILKPFLETYPTYSSILHKNDATNEAPGILKPYWNGCFPFENGAIPLSSNLRPALSGLLAEKDVSFVHSTFMYRPFAKRQSIRNFNASKLNKLSTSINNKCLPRFVDVKNSQFVSRRFFCSWLSSQ